MLLRHAVFAKAVKIREFYASVGERHDVVLPAYRAKALVRDYLLLKSPFVGVIHLVAHDADGLWHGSPLTYAAAKAIVKDFEPLQPDDVLGCKPDVF
jgi:hypothetical protein